MNTKNILLISGFILLLFQGCYKEPDFTNFDYETYNRVVGPDGGRIDFYGNYADDNSNNVLISLDVPQGALDSMMVFNMYQFEDYELVLQMKNGYAEIGSKFLYFVPFYESDGYHERGQLDLSYHLSLDFNSPIAVTYNFLADGGGLSAETWQEAELYHDHYKKTNRSYRLYRIKIPKLDEWGEGDNIYVNWNNQGYPEGYDRTDLYYIISGIWSPLSEWGKGYLSLENWEPVSDFNLDTENSSVTFEIPNTDYLYLICRIIYIKAEDVPIKIINLVQQLYPALEVERASFADDKFTVILSDNSYANFSKNGDFLYLTNDNISKSDLPLAAQAYVNINFVDDPIKKVTLKQAETWETYEILLRSGIKLFFDGMGNLTGTFQYGLDPSELPANALSFIQENYPGALITNVTFNKENLNAPEYIVYLSSDAKVYFGGDGSWSETIYYRFDEDQLPDGIIEYFASNYPNTDFSEINYTQSQESGNNYEIYLVDNKWFSFNDDGVLTDVEFENIEESELPTAISSFINTHFANKEITQIAYYSYDQGNDEGYDIYFDDKLNIEFDPSGNITALYGDNISHLPVPARTYVQNNYPNENLLYCNFDSEGYTTTLGVNETITHTWDLFFAGDLWIGLNSDPSFAYLFKQNAAMSDLIGPIVTYLADYPGLTVVELAKYHSASYGELIYYLYLSDGTELIFDMSGVLLDQFKKAGKSVTKKSVQEKKISSKRAEVLRVFKDRKIIK